MVSTVPCQTGQPSNQVDTSSCMYLMKFYLMYICLYVLKVVNGLLGAHPDRKFTVSVVGNDYTNFVGIAATIQ